MQITIEITDETYAAMTAIAVDPVDWLTNAINARAEAAAGEVKHTPAWNTAVVSFANAGGDLAAPDSEVKILAHAVEKEIVPTALKRNAIAIEAREAEAAEAAAAAEAAK